MKNSIIYTFVFVCMFAINENVFAQIEKTNDQLCYEQVGPSRYRELPDSLGGGAYCDCLDGYEWDITTLHCLKKETSLTEKQNQALKKVGEEIDKARAEKYRQNYLENNIKQSQALTKEEYSYVNEKGLKRPIPVIYRFILGIVFVLFWLYLGVIYYKRPENVEKRRLKREQLEKQREIERQAQEERDRTAKLEKECERQRIESERQKEKEIQMAEYQQLRKEIEAMPKSANYKKAVFLKNGEKCEMCGNNKKEDLEIHHRKSFYSIVQKYQIKNIAEAFECDELWDVENGSVLCKKCHAKMESSKYHVLNNLAK